MLKSCAKCGYEERALPEGMPHLPKDASGIVALEEIR
jgi:hypothetical protein